MMWKKGTQLHRIIARVMRPGPELKSPERQMDDSAGNAERSVP
jgi:hypothetical protein